MNRMIVGNEPLAFEMSAAQLRARRNAKWNQYGPDVLPAFVAEMDFHIAAPIQAAIERIVHDRDYGYPMRDGQKAGQAIGSAFAARMKRLYGWELNPDLVVPLSDLVQGTYAPILAFSDPGDGIVLHTPNYPPFREAIVSTGRKLTSLPMRDNGSRYAFDLSDIEASVDKNTRIFVLCNPQNPTGRVFSRDELTAIANFVLKHDLIVIADEIHSDLIHLGNKHIPFASLSPDIAARTVTLNSATKTFNIPGLRTAVIAFGSAELQARFHKRIPLKLTGASNIIGIDATVTAWNEGGDWLEGTMAHLLRARNHLTEVLKAEAPDIHFYTPEATYLAWLDCSKIKLPTSAFQFFLDSARIGFSAGETFDPACPQFVRFNFATSMTILDEILDRFIIATKTAKRHNV